MTVTYAVRAPDVVHETIDGETVIINMANGAYYRLEAAAAEAWQRLAMGTDAAELCTVIGARFEAPAAEIENAVAAFFTGLEEFKLIAKANGAPGAQVPPPGNPPGARATFPGLAIHRFTDLQELLLLDPVHEVDESGWPVQPPAR